MTKSKRETRRQLTPEQFARNELGRGTISAIQLARQREKLALLACSATWADDQWFGDVHRNPTRFWGTHKRRCANMNCRRDESSNFIWRGVAVYQALVQDP